MTLLAVAARIAAKPKGFGGIPDADQVLLDSVLEGSSEVPDRVPDSWGLSDELKLLVEAVGGMEASEALREVFGRSARSQQSKAAARRLSEFSGMTLWEVREISRFLGAGNVAVAIVYAVKHKSAPWFPRFAKRLIREAVESGVPRSCLAAYKELREFAGKADAEALRRAITGGNDLATKIEYARHCPVKDLPAIEREVLENGHEGRSRWDAVMADRSQQS